MCFFLPFWQAWSTQSLSHASAPVSSKPCFSSFHIAEIPICLFLKHVFTDRCEEICGYLKNSVLIKASWWFIIKTSWRSHVSSSSPFLNGSVWKLGTPKKHLMISHRIHGAGILMLTWLGYIDGMDVTIYGIHIDPMSYSYTTLW